MWASPSGLDGTRRSIVSGRVPHEVTPGHWPMGQRAWARAAVERLESPLFCIYQQLRPEVLGVANDDGIEVAGDLLRT